MHLKVKITIFFLNLGMPGMHGGPQPPGPHPSGMMMNRPPMPQQPQMPGKVQSTIKTNINHIKIVST